MAWRTSTSVLLLLALLTSRSAAAAEPEIPPSTFARGEVVARVVVQDEPEQQYALYLPSRYAPDRVWPVLYILDPRGRALFALELFRRAAEEHGYVLLSSYQSRSDTLASVTANAFEALLRDSQQRFSVDRRRFYLTGMSGTSHATWRYSLLLQGHVAGIIGCAGGLPNDWTREPEAAPFAYFGITATADFNYQEMHRLDELLERLGAPHRLEVFEGRHGWPPADLAGAALDWMELQAMRAGLTPRRKEFIQRQFEASLAAAEAADSPERTLRRYRDLVRDFDGFVEVERFAPIIRELAESSEVRRATARRRKLAGQELAYFERRLGHWLTELKAPERRPPTLRRSLVDLQIGLLRKKAADAADVLGAQSAQRILEGVFGAVAFYLPNEFLARGDPERAALSLAVAVAIYPDRPRTRWQLAEVLAGAGRIDEAFEALRDAIALGRVDVERLKSDPTWSELRARPAEWEALLGSL